RCERRRPGVPPQPTLRRLAAAPGARPRAVGSRGRGRAQAVADPRRPPLARPRSPRLQGPLLRRPPRPRRGLSPGHGLGLAHRPVHRRLAEGPPQRPRRRPPLPRRFRAPPQRGGPRHHQRDLRRRAPIYPARLHCPGLERRRGAPLLDENLGLSQTWSRVSKAAFPSPMDKNQREAGDRSDRGVSAEGRRLEKGLILLANLRGWAIGTSPCLGSVDVTPWRTRLVFRIVTTSRFPPPRGVSAASDPSASMPSGPGARPGSLR